MPRDIVMLNIAIQVEADRKEKQKQAVRANLREANQAYALAMQKLRDAAVAEALAAADRVIEDGVGDEDA